MKRKPASDGEDNLGGGPQARHQPKPQGGLLSINHFFP